MPDIIERMTDLIKSRQLPSDLELQRAYQLGYHHLSMIIGTPMLTPDNIPDLKTIGMSLFPGEPILAAEAQRGFDMRFLEGLKRPLPSEGDDDNDDV